MSVKYFITSVILQLFVCITYLEDFMTAGLTQSSSVKWWQVEPGTCISNNVSGDAGLAGWGTDYTVVD